MRIHINNKQKKIFLRSPVLGSWSIIDRGDFFGYQDSNANQPKSGGKE
jgi:hypothetical protein